MSTFITPRMERAYAYASNEAFCFHPDGIVPLRRDFLRMVAADVSEHDIILALLEVPKIILRGERIDAVVGRIAEILDPSAPLL